jgi:hypothetical protein
MPTYTDQFFYIDPYSPPAAGTAMNFSHLDITDANGDNDFDRNDGDSVDGVDISSSYAGDTVTINVAGVGNITYTGVTFYLANGQQVFTPNDGQALQNGTLVSTTWTPSQGPLLVSELGPTCFTPGTLIDTVSGPRPIEEIKPGELVRTRDHGFLPVRWIGGGTYEAHGNAAPVRIDAGALGNARDLVVSQQHRMLITGWRAELYLGTSEALVAAKHLVNGDTIRCEEGGTVEYLHLLFDEHELVWAEGTLTESFHPAHALALGDTRSLAEIRRLFPGRLPEEHGGWPAARRVARQYEGVLLAA